VIVRHRGRLESSLFPQRLLATTIGRSLLLLYSGALRVTARPKILWRALEESARDAPKRAQGGSATRHL